MFLGNVSEDRKREMEVRKAVYFRKFSENINIQLNEQLDTTLVDRHKKEYAKLLKNTNQKHFNNNG